MSAIKRKLEMHKKLASNIKNVNKTIVKIDHGGCGFFALELYKQLSKRKFLSSIVLVETDVDTKRTVDKMIFDSGEICINSAYLTMFAKTDIHRQDVSFCNGHIAIKFDGRLYDNNGQNFGNTISEHITAENMERLLKRDCWNEDFTEENDSNLFEDLKYLIDYHIS